MTTTHAAGASPEPGSDLDLIGGLVRREETALRTLITTHGKYVYGKALQILRNPNLAEEVAQDTFVTLWREPSRFDVSRGNLRSLLILIARNKSIDLVRHEEMIRYKESLPAEIAAWVEAPPDGRVGDELSVRTAIAKLPRSKREAIFLAYYRGLTYRQVAQELKIPEGTAKTRIRDALIKLKVALGPDASDGLLA